MAAVGLQIAIWLDFARGTGALDAAVPYLHILSYLPLIIFVCYNRKSWGMLVIGLGLLLNLLVICANGGAMPVDPAGLAPPLRQELIEGAGSPLHEVLSEESALKFLGDVIRVPYGKHRIVSAGDLLMAIGLGLFIQQGMLPPQGNRKDGRTCSNTAAPAP